ncbi:hypothetical protein BH20CHL1_BH20CHL1_09240 [soil metagenome]
MSIETTTLATLAERANTEHRACESAIRTGLEHALNAGHLLIEAKALCPHGEWLPWLHEHFEGSERTAQAYMRVAREYPALEADGNTQRVTDLSYREALKALAEPAEHPNGDDSPPVVAVPPAPVDGKSSWRRYVEDIVGCYVYETPEEWKTVTGVNLDGDELFEDWFTRHLARISAVYWFRHGSCANCRRQDTSDYACLPLPPGLHLNDRDLVRLGTLTHFRVGDFANWADRHGMMETVSDAGQKAIRFLPVHPTNFEDCPCEWCEECRTEEPERSHEIYLAAIGFAWQQAGMMLPPESWNREAAS